MTTPTSTGSVHRDRAASLFLALGDPIRLGIVSRLSDEGPLPTVRLREGTTVSRQAITKHLHLLDEVGLVTSKRIARDRQWRLETSKLEMARAYLDRVSTRWDARLNLLKTYIEGD